METAVHRHPKPNFLATRLRPWDLITAFGAILSAATLLAFLGRFGWFLDLFSHFRVQFFLSLLAVALLLLFPRRYKASAFFSVFVAVNFCALLPLYLGKPPQPPGASHPYRALLMNVNTAAGNPGKVSQTITQLAPDFVVLEEVSDQWLSILSNSLKAYPYSQAMARSDNFGIALFSKHPFARSEIQHVGEAEVPSVIAELQLPDGRLTVIGTHPLPPAGAEYSRLRNDQLARLPAMLKQLHSPVLLLGDLNATPWCTHFTRLLRESGLRDSSQGRGVLPTWPTYFPLLLIPIDHCLHTPDIHITRKATGPKVGSDHYPLVVDFVLASPSPTNRQQTAASTATPSPAP